MTGQAVASGTGLFQTERQRHIAQLISGNGRAEVSELAERFGVTTETIRRDLSELQANRLVRRVHGGAIPWETLTTFEPLLANRKSQNLDEKRRLAVRAVEEFPDTGTVIIDSGSTLGVLAELVPDRDLQVITNSLVTAQILAERDRTEVSVLGGRLDKRTLAMVDAETVEAVRPLAVDTLFISADAASADTGLTTPYRREAALKSTMIRAARRVVVLVDHTKFGLDQFICFASWSDVDVLITNRELDETTVAGIESTGTIVALC